MFRMLQITRVATHLNAQFIASLVGKIISMGLALGLQCLRKTRGNLGNIKLS